VETSLFAYYFKVGLPLLELEEGVDLVQFNYLWAVRLPLYQFELLAHLIDLINSSEILRDQKREYYLFVENWL